MILVNLAVLFVAVVPLIVIPIPAVIIVAAPVMTTGAAGAMIHVVVGALILVPACTVTFVAVNSRLLVSVAVHANGLPRTGTVLTRNMGQLICVRSE
jgi:hypothetical protein